MLNRAFGTISFGNYALRRRILFTEERKARKEWGLSDLCELLFNLVPALPG